MKNTYAIAAIAMVAVIMGLSAFAPAVMASPPESEHKTVICHYEANDVDDEGAPIDPYWALLDVDNKGKLNGHFDKNGDTRHYDVSPDDGDFIIDDEDVDETNDLQVCLDLLPVE